MFGHEIIIFSFTSPQKITSHIVRCAIPLIIIIMYRRCCCCWSWQWNQAGECRDLKSWTDYTFNTHNKTHFNLSSVGRGDETLKHSPITMEQENSACIFNFYCKRGFEKNGNSTGFLQRRTSFEFACYINCGNYRTRVLLSKNITDDFPFLFTRCFPALGLKLRLI